MLISAMLGHQDGAALVCGTGSGLYIRSKGAQYSIGGWGYILEGCGSGFILGRRALNAVVRQADGRGEKTLLYGLVRDQLKAPPEESVPAIYAGGRPFIASFAHTVFEARRAGDGVAAAIFDQNAQALAEMTRAAEPYYAAEFDVVMSGGIFAAFPEYAEAVTRLGSPRAHMIRADVPPVYGCALENALADGPVDEAAFRARFMADYPGK